LWTRNDHPVPGATVEVITGDKKSLTTGEDGWFILTSVRDGTIVFRTTKPGYYLTTTAVRMNECARVVVHVETLDSKLSPTRQAEASGTSNNAQVAWHDATLRMSAKGLHAVVISEEELAPLADMSLGDAIKRTKTGATLAFDLQNAAGQICGAARRAERPWAAPRSTHGAPVTWRWSSSTRPARGVRHHCALPTRSRLPDGANPGMPHARSLLRCALDEVAGRTHPVPA